MKIYSRLILILALFLVACKTSHTDKAFDWLGHSCTFTGTIESPGLLDTVSYPTEYDGTFRCTDPDGANLTCPNTNQPAGSAEFRAKVKLPKDITEENFWSHMDCDSSSAAIATPTPTASPQPTSTPLPTATPSALLSGEVSACSTKDGFINFKLAAISPLVNESDIVLTINGAQVPCTFAGSDNSLLSCPLPAGVSFPAQIQVAQGNTPVNDFNYDGGGCVSATGPSNNGGGATGEGSGPAVPTSCGLGDCPP